MKHLHKQLDQINHKHPIKVINRNNHNHNNHQHKINRILLNAGLVQLHSINISINRSPFLQNLD